MLPKRQILPMLLMMSALVGCDNGHKSFEEASALKCPESTRRVEETKSSYPKYYCVGVDGRTGEWLEFDVNGRLRTRAYYVKDKLEGEWFQYHTSGSIETRGMMKNGLRVGSWEQYYVNGNLRSLKNYKDNHLNGNVKLFYKEGGLMADGDYVSDFEEGKWRVYTPSGELARECEMEHGLEKECVIHLADFQPSTYRYAAGDKGPL